MDLMRLVVVGSVDDGKSTLVGRLLVDTDSLLTDQWQALGAATERRGGTGVDLALVTDGLRAERDQAITIDVAHRRFATGRRVFLVADCPGHVEYTRNTVTGASTADAALVLVDAVRGVREQTRRHSAILGLLRVPQVIFVLNKMDAVAWDPAVIAGLETELAELARATGVTARCVPVSALTGQGIDALLGVLDELPTACDEGPFRLPVQQVDASGLAVAGRVASGRVTVGDPLRFGGETRHVVAVERPVLGPGPDQAQAGESVTLRLDRPGPVRGDVLCHPGHEIPRRSRLTAQLCWLTEDEPRRRLLLKAGAATTWAEPTTITATWDLDAGAWAKPRPLRLNDLAQVRLDLADPVAIDDYARLRVTGSFLLIDPATGTTVAAGMNRENQRDDDRPS